MDGGTLFVSMHRSLLRLLEATEECLEHLPCDALEEAKRAVAKSPKLPWSETKSRAGSYLEHLVRVPTLNVPGTATLFVEIAQAVFFLGRKAERLCKNKA